MTAYERLSLEFIERCKQQLAETKRQRDRPPYTTVADPEGKADRDKLDATIEDLERLIAREEGL